VCRRRHLTLRSGWAALLCAAWPLGAAPQVPDPTQPPSSGALESAPGLDAAPVVPGQSRLSAIVVSPTRRVAVIDGVPVRVGDEVSGGARVIEIEPLSVRLRGPDGEVVLSIAGPPVKEKKR
jgi:hypothetical protein